MGAWRHNSQVKANLVEKVQHLAAQQKADICRLLCRYPQVTRDHPGHTTIVVHDIVVGDAKHIKQSPYRVHPEQRANLQREIEFMLDIGLIKKTHSEWSSPCHLVPRPDGTPRFCVDYRKVNDVIMKDSYPLPPY